MLTSEIRNNGGAPRLVIDGEITTAIAYTTYFEERSAYLDFLKAGYRIFFVNVAMTKLPINSYETGFTPFRVGVFDEEGKEDYSEFEAAVKKILRACPDAIIFPRIYVSMPRWWTERHPNEVVDTRKAGKREILFSEIFRRDAKELLLRIVRHIKNADYAPRIGGWQICGGQTQEWFYPDMLGGLLGQAAKKAYADWHLCEYGTAAALPSPEDFKAKGSPLQTLENARRYAIFANLAVAKTLDLFAEAVKEETNRAQIVGSFYGYAYHSGNTPLFGSHGIRSLLDSNNLDFFSSPNAYAQGRRFGIDWADMLPVDSITRHGKLCFIECDIRTYLTCAIQDLRPGEYADDMYRTGDGASVWVGPPTALLSRFALRKCFAHQLTKGSAIWWFDMWGGWYDDPMLMQDIEDMKRIYDLEKTKVHEKPLPRVAFFADESAYANLCAGTEEILAVEKSRTEIGLVGIPFDFLLVEDADALADGYSAAVFCAPVPSEAGKRAMDKCKALGIPYLSASLDHPICTAKEIHAFLKQNGVHLYSDEGDVVYLGEGYIALHSDKGGEKLLTLPSMCKICPVFGAEIPAQITQTIRFTLEANDTALFEIHSI